jgi:hypothetical protein
VTIELVVLLIMVNIQNHPLAIRVKLFIIC